METITFLFSCQISVCLIDIVQIDCTTESKPCTEHNIHAYPSLKLFKDGREVSDILLTVPSENNEET